MADQVAEGLLSPFLRKQRLGAVKPYLNGRILDIGCGSGALAGMIDPALYVGIDIDETSLNRAKFDFPRHLFDSFPPVVTENFDTVVSLAVIEHVPDPTIFLTSLSQYLNNDRTARIVVTTPHPSVGWVHEVGASIGLFSQHASEEHEKLLDQNTLFEVGRCAGLVLVDYKRFLFGGNQLAVFKSARMK
ncbi:bifunctional 2-polyprenyl-6-hydroxyphenol methylase/3-demethylubiquinol 3-O-methyltransferase UbiG [Desulfobulbus sp.]|uniref:class I SAM-dependent methyltransferase n=1 Tax=Desulfobulbus sp. TaxID=895 RepID=UPI0027B92549|nr:methyltransferase domain-containing protein [Desulfobulbus sp.]